MSDLLLQLIRKSLTDLGHGPVAELLDERLKLASSSDLSTVATLLSLVESGDLRDSLDYLNATDPIAPLDRHHKAIAVYLVTRTAFLEKLVKRALNGSLPSSKEIFSYLTKDVAAALSQVENLELARSLSSSSTRAFTRASEGPILLPLALNPPSSEQLESDIFSPKVLLTASSVYLGSASRDPIARLRSSLAADLSEFVELKPDNLPGKLLNLETLPEILNSAYLYQTQKSLYYLPPRIPSEVSGFPSIGKNTLPVKDDFPLHHIRTIADHTDEVWFTRFSPSGRFMATGSLDGTCNIYSVMDQFKLVATLVVNPEDESKAFVKSTHKPSLDKRKGVIYLCWEPHERYIVTCCLDTVIRVWNVEKTTLGKRTTRSNIEVDKSKLASCFTLGEAKRTWSCEFLNYEKNLTPHFIIGSPDKVLKAFSIDGVEILDFYSDADEWLTILDDDFSGSAKAKRPDDLQLEKEKDSDHERSGTNEFNRINDFAISPNGKILATANNDKKVFFYRIPNLFDPSATTSRIALLNLNGTLTSCSISSNGKYMLLSIAPEDLQVWDISPLENSEKPFLKQKFFGHSQAVFMVRSCFGYLSSIGQNDELVLSGSYDGYVYIWRLETGQLISRVAGHKGLCNSVDWNRFYNAKKTGIDYGSYWCSVGDDKLVKIWGPQRT